MHWTFLIDGNRGLAFLFMLDECLDPLTHMLCLVWGGMIATASSRATTPIKGSIDAARGHCTLPIAAIDHVCHFVRRTSAILCDKVPNRMLLAAALSITRKWTVKQVLVLLLIVLLDPYILKHFLGLFGLVRLDPNL